VILDEGASRIADVLQDALGVGFHVVAFPPASDVIVVLTAAPPGLIAAHRQLHPTFGLVVTRAGDQPDAVAAALNAGADDCLRASDPRELAARVMALSRRRALTTDRHRRQPGKFDVVDPGA
jgi:DNA-binding response OmpR family regulator